MKYILEYIDYGVESTYANMAGRAVVTALAGCG